MNPQSDFQEELPQERITEPSLGTAIIREPETGAPADPIRDPRKEEFAVSKKAYRAVITLVLTIFAARWVWWKLVPPTVTPLIGWIINSLSSFELTAELALSEPFFSGLFKGLAIAETVVISVFSAVISWFIMAPLLTIFVARIYATPPYIQIITLWLSAWPNVRGPKIFLVFAPFEKAHKIVTTRLLELYVPYTITADKDGWSIVVNAVVLFFIDRPKEAYLAAEDLLGVLRRVVETTLFQVTSGHDYEYLRTKKEEVSRELLELAEKELDRWEKELGKDLGIKFASYRFTDAKLADKVQADKYIAAAADSRMAGGTAFHQKADAQYLIGVAKEIYEEANGKISWDRAYELASRSQQSSALVRGKGGAMVNVGPRDSLGSHSGTSQPEGENEESEE